MSVTEHSREEGGYERTPPHDIMAEQSVLGGMLLSKEAISQVVEIVRSVDFYRPAHQTIFDAAVDLFSRGEPVDAISVNAELTKRGEVARVGGAPYLHTLTEAIPTAANAGYYARIVGDRAVLRRLVEAGTRIAQIGYSGDGEVDDLVDHAQAEVFRVAERRTGEDYLSLSDVMPGALDEIEAISAHDGSMTGVPTGFTDFDQLSNGLHPGQMVIIAARPAVGKSTLALDFARAASIKNQLTSVIFSLEMGRNEIVMRLLSAEARVPLHTMRSGLMTDDDWARLARRMGEVASAPLFIDDSPNMSMMEIRAKCRRLKQQHDLKLIIVDYLQLMSAAGRVESRQQEVSEMSRSLKLLAKELEVPVIALSQLNRGPEQRTDKKPQVSDLRESGCLTAETRVLRSDTGAETTMGELYESGERDIPVWALDDALRLVPRTMSHVFHSGTKETFRLRLRSGRAVVASANHPFLGYGGWTPLGELAPGDRIGVPRQARESQPRSAGARPGTAVVPLSDPPGGTPSPRPVRRGTAVGKAARRLGSRAACTAERVRKLPGARRLARGGRGAPGREPAAVTRAPLPRRTAPERVPVRAEVERVAEQPCDTGREVLVTNDVYWDEITAIEPLGVREVFDATVPDGHNFVANGISVHNSIEQDADMVILLYREDVHEKESPRAGEADLIVAKHRNGPTATVTVAFQGHYSRFVDMAPG
ncbi:replicative DNA helicase [Lipingzhangella halophila]|uniref:Replicative DNA helicase n=1 Tax=Lipingzhangella halophila TaxID=1783352 RepID=A0A7W7RNR2_9ACTN|nr:replicative DNA helicase [Lipingzhangella halophila]MBB4935394.1 replicative DNA helicase [Lipingzhangella halophila]